MFRYIPRALHILHRFRNALTIGVRAVVRDGEGRVFLVKHSYVPGWYFPGGGVDPGETIFEAVERELREEGNILLTGMPRLVAVYQNHESSPRDHVMLFECVDWEQPEPPAVPNAEIVAADFFALSDLPKGTTKATLKRLEELAAGGPYNHTW